MEWNFGANFSATNTVYTGHIQYGRLINLKKVIKIINYVMFRNFAELCFLEFRENFNFVSREIRGKFRESQN